jgi:hypothetical protein
MGFNGRAAVLVTPVAKGERGGTKGRHRCEGDRVRLVCCFVVVVLTGNRSEQHVAAADGRGPQSPTQPAVQPPVH